MTAKIPDRLARLAGLLAWGLLPAGPALAQVALSSGNAAYTTTAAGITIDVSGSYSGSITLSHPNCTLNFNSTTYGNSGGSFSVTAGATGCTVNVNGSSHIKGNGHSIAAAATINNNATWSADVYSTGFASGSVINNAGTWNAGQYHTFSGLTINNSGTWSTVNYGTSGSGITTINNLAGGTWTKTLGEISANFVLTNSAGATWSQKLPGTGTNSFTLTNNGNWTGEIVFPGGTSSFTNRTTGGPTATAALSNLAFSGNVTISNGHAGGSAATLTFLTDTTPNSTTTITNYTGTITSAGTFQGSATVDNRATWNAATLAPSGGYFTNASGGTVAASTSLAPTGGTFRNDGTVTTPTVSSSGTITNYGTLTPTGSFTNLSGGTVNVYSPINPGGSYTNQGTTNNYSTIQPAGPFVNDNTSAVLNNSGTIQPGTSFTNGATLTNSGTIRTGTFFSAASSGSFTNASGALLVVGTDLTNSGAFTNNGRIYLTSASGTYTQRNSAAVTNAGYIEVAGNFTNLGNIIGGSTTSARGRIRVAGASSNSGSFSTSGYSDFCDGSSGTGGQFDTQAGWVGSSAGPDPYVTYCQAPPMPLPQPLPVVLVQFGARAAGGRVLLSWLTASERNSAYFAVERSLDGQAFAPIATVAARGSSAVATTYAAQDDAPPAGPAYYRLRQVDQEGSRTYSAVVVAQIGAALGVPPSPNPTEGLTTLDLTAWPAAPVTLQLLCPDGRTAWTRTVAGGTAQLLELQALPAGLYLLRVTSPAGTCTHRLLRR